MVRRLFAAAAFAAAFLLTACATAPKEAVVASPNFDGVYRLAYAANGGALYYRFYPEGIVLSARTDAPTADVLPVLTLENANVSRGKWTAANGEVKVGVNEGDISYDSRFDLRPDGRIALHGLPRAFEFLRHGRDIELSSR